MFRTLALLGCAFFLNVRVKLGDRIYPVRAERVPDRATVESLWDARWQKYEEGEPPAVPEDYWLFHLRSR